VGRRQTSGSSGASSNLVIAMTVLIVVLTLGPLWAVESSANKPPGSPA